MDQHYHAVSFAAVAIPTASFAVKASPYITDIVGLMGMCWYIYLAIREVKRHLRHHK